MNKLFIILALACSFSAHAIAISTPHARELTDQEIDDADSAPGCGFSKGRRTGEDAKDIQDAEEEREATKKHYEEFRKNKR